MGLLRTIAIILLVYFALRLLTRWFAPKLFAFAVKKAEARFREMYGMENDQRNPGKETTGDVIIDSRTSKKKEGSPKVGEYIEFEEID